VVKHLDFETRSRVDLKKVGLWAYALHPSTQITCFTISDGGKVRRTYRGLERKFDWTGVTTEIGAQDMVIAHNAPFEYAIWNLIGHRRHGWPARWAPSLWRCTMARALAGGLPADLDSLGRVLRIRTPKDLDGKKAMLRTCKPLPDGTFDESPEVFETLYKYNGTDVQAEEEVDALLPDLAPQEWKVWELDLEINRRGVAIDKPFAECAATLSDWMVNALNKRLQALTGGVVDKATQVTALKYYLKDAHGIVRDSLDKESVTDLMLDPTLPQLAREVLSVRRQVGKKNSVAKYSAALTMACPDGRVRGLLQYHAAHTGRWGGRGLQPQNFPKGWGKSEQQTRAISIITGRTEGATLIGEYGDKAMDALSNSLRGLFVAAPGKTLVCADFNAIEARVLFWLAGEESALAAYRRGESPYLDMGASLYGRPITKHGDPQEYDIAKRTVLGCGYGMGWRKFRDNIYSETAKAGSPVLISEALARRAVTTYREKYAKVRSLWYEMERAAINAVQNPGRSFACAGGKVLWGLTQDRRFLACRLPSGRFLRYWHPCVVEAWRTFCEDLNCVHWLNDDPSVCPQRKKVRQLAYEGVNPYTKQWGRIHVYGGLLVENVDQGTSRDLLAHGMLNVNGPYPVLLTIHDEVLSEAEADPTDDKDTLADFVEKMTTLPAWAKGCPVAAEGWIGGRYRK
jgi:DNA polymerase